MDIPSDGGVKSNCLEDFIEVKGTETLVLESVHSSHST